MEATVTYIAGGPASVSNPLLTMPSWSGTYAELGIALIAVVAAIGFVLGRATRVQGERARRPDPYDRFRREAPGGEEVPPVSEGTTRDESLDDLL